MTNFLASALRLPVADIEALIQGQTIVALAWSFINPGQSFALYPNLDLVEGLPLEQRYRTNFLPIAKDVCTELNSQLCYFWAKCEDCEILDNSESLEAISSLTIWTKEYLKSELDQRSYLFLVYLRVFRSNCCFEVIKSSKGQFLALREPVKVFDSYSVISSEAFDERRKRILNLDPPLHPELEELQAELAQLIKYEDKAKRLEEDLRIFLGWCQPKKGQLSQNDQSFLSKIIMLADRSIEEEKGQKSNYQAGTDFENIVRDSLEILGFKIEESYKGGAGGLDLFCSKPYSLAGECKAGKSIPDRSVEELDRIAKRHLRDNYEQALKLIIGSGKPSKQLQESSMFSKVSIMNATSLRKLVELEKKYPRSVDLIALKEYLKPGQIDSQIDQYIEQVIETIKIRSHIVSLLQRKTPQHLGIDYLWGAYDMSSPPKNLSKSEFHEILVELSSPLAGYLGRKREADGSDRFYFLRDLPVDDITS